MDLWFVNWISRHLHNPFFDLLMPFITALGNYGAIWFVFSLLLLARKRTRRWGIMSVLALFAALLSGEFIIKNIVARARPFTHIPGLSLLIPKPLTYSFPSGHTASSFAAATVIAFMDKRLGRWALVLAALIAFSRLYLSVHYITDILAGILLGVTSAYLAKSVCKKIQKIP